MELFHTYYYIVHLTYTRGLISELGFGIFRLFFSEMIVKLEGKHRTMSQNQDQTKNLNTLVRETIAHRIRISEILPWDSKSYLTHAVLPRLSRECFIHWLYWNSRTWSSSDVIVMLMWRHHVKLYLSLFSDFLKLILKKKTVVSKKKNPLIVWW